MQPGLWPHKSAAYHIALYSTKRSYSHTVYLHHCHKVNRNHKQFLDGYRLWAWSQLWEYCDVPFMLQCWQLLFSKLWEIDRRHQTQWYNWHLWTSHYTLYIVWNCCTIYSIVHTYSCTLTYIHMHTHTLYTPAVAVSCTSWASWCVHPPLSSTEERSVAGESSPLFWDGGLLEKLLLEKEKNDSGVAGIMHLCGSCAL